MRSFFVLFTAFIVFLSSCHDENTALESPIIAAGQMPNMVRDPAGAIHIVYGHADSILYTTSSDKGKSFSTPGLVAVLPHLAASHMRGPQIAATTSGLIVTACNSEGNIFSFTKEEGGEWLASGRINDADTTAKENLMALSASGDRVYAVWLDLRHGHNEIFGAGSADGGKTWSKNRMIYASPETSVCPCCKPAVAVKGDKVFVMFRNWLKGNRDLYLIQSSDGGNSFGPAEKLGLGNWALDGCPMDGGGLAIDQNGNPETVWNRKGIIYACEPGNTERELGTGKSCTLESVNGKNVYAWVENGEVILRKPGGEKENLGKGQLPVIKAVNDEQILCVWEHDSQIYKAVVAI